MVAAPGRFDYKLYAHFLREIEKGVGARRGQDAYTTLAYYPKGFVGMGEATWDRPRCTSAGPIATRAVGRGMQLPTAPGLSQLTRCDLQLAL